MRPSRANDPDGSSWVGSCRARLTILMGTTSRYGLSSLSGSSGQPSLSGFFGWPSPFGSSGQTNSVGSQNIIKPKINIVKIKFYLTRNSIIIFKQEIEM